MPSLVLQIGCNEMQSAQPGNSTYMLAGFSSPGSLGAAGGTPGSSSGSGSSSGRFAWWRCACCACFVMLPLYALDAPRSRLLYTAASPHAEASHCGTDGGPATPRLSLPPAARTLLPFPRSYCRTAARRYRVPLSDCWDEAVTALLRASLHFRPGPGTFSGYARTAIVRGLWRYCRRPAQRTVSLDTVAPPSMPDVETLLIALEDGLQPASGRRLPALKQAAP